MMWLSMALAGCGGEESEPEAALSSMADESQETEAPETTQPLSETDQQLLGLVDDLGLARDPLAGRSLPTIDQPIAQLGRALFFSKSLGGQFDAACASCHHPVLGGADQLTFSVGVDALNPDLLGIGRRNKTDEFEVPRNAPTVFNTGLWDTGLFWDSRVESLGKEPGTHGSQSGIRTPDSAFGEADSAAGANLAAAQARFPVVSEYEMRGETFEDGSDNDTIRDHLAARIGGYGVGSGELENNTWLPRFQEAFGVTSSAESLITFERIAQAISEYEQSMVFVDNPWQRYLGGNVGALTEQQKRGAILFFSPPQAGGAGCAACHNGPLFSDGQHHTVAFPQFGPGQDDGTVDDLGRERVTADPTDRFRFRTPSLLNIAQTAPYGHAGSFDTLERVVRHYLNPPVSVERFFEQAEWCQLPQFEHRTDCSSLFPDSRANSTLAVEKLGQELQAGTSRLGRIRLNDNDVLALVSFLEALTDPCVTNRDCLSPWIAGPEDDADGHLLRAVDGEGQAL
jgi:cytochrome c peroxidase